MKDDKAAELLAAVRAVESGERSAAEFFTEPAQAPARTPAQENRGAQRPTAPPRPAPQDGRAVPVPEGVRAVLAEGGAPESLAPQAVEALGEQAEELLRADPWQLLAVPSVRPEQADGFARALLGPECGPGDERRAQALVLRLLERAALAGHTALEPDALAKGLARYAVPEPEEAVRAAVDAGAVLVFEDALDTLDAGAVSAESDGAEGEAEERPVRLLMGLDRWALAEESLADGLARLTATLGTGDAGSEEDPSGAVREVPDGDWESAAAAAGSPSAAELIRACAGHGLVAHTGGEAARAEPAALLAAARGLGLRAWGAAHSPYGARQLAALAAGTEDESRDSGVTTVSSLLSGADGPARDADGAWELDLLVVCDAPQLDAETAAALVESLPDGARLVLSGDPQLLGPAGAGRVFADLRAARSCPVVVSRTPDPGPVGELVSGIGIGELNEVEAPGKEVVIVPVRDPAEAVLRTVQLVADSVPRAIGVPPERTQVITPGHGGAVGTRALNTALKERLNPGPGRFGGFDPGDRVAYSPVPGRTALGSVVSADDAGLRLDCAGGVVVPPERVAETVRHGWAVTAHQAVGTRWPAAVVVLPGDATGGLTREWVYTAFSRGEQHLSVVQGAGDALPRAVASSTDPAPTTRLSTLLTQSAARTTPTSEA
ncbi:helix-hairpin-helix domain-containing protein [Streptomyces sp. HNM0574]|uniref:helix-hairpin-helix domain-containing protein n=1 Tax=Streptomyces sp. HNM0574 TaxID=2714954 RepID=UPI00146A7E72|nr:AAA family ATPase [Streptomyces sp. HNM0574]